MVMVSRHSGDGGGSDFGMVATVFPILLPLFILSLNHL